MLKLRNFRSSALDTAPLLILGNKQDIDGCLPLLEIKHAFHDCSNRIGSRDCMIRPCSALTGAGVTEGIEWMAKCVKLNPYRPPRQDGRWLITEYCNNVLVLRRPFNFISNSNFLELTYEHDCAIQNLLTRFGVHAIIILFSDVKQICRQRIWWYRWGNWLIRKTLPGKKFQNFKSGWLILMVNFREMS